jgi:hypothetical protein
VEEGAAAARQSARKLYRRAEEKRMSDTVMTVEELQGEAALELPKREMLSLIVVKNVLNGTRLKINVNNNDVALQVCAQVNVINALIGNVLVCKIKQ